jgi:hypothetical protein
VMVVKLPMKEVLYDVEAREKDTFQFDQFD